MAFLRKIVISMVSVLRVTKAFIAAKMKSGAAELRLCELQKQFKGASGGGSAPRLLEVDERLFELRPKELLLEIDIGDFERFLLQSKIHFDERVPHKAVRLHSGSRQVEFRMTKHEQALWICARAKSSAGLLEFATGFCKKALLQDFKEALPWKLRN